MRRLTSRFNRLMQAAKTGFGEKVYTGARVSGNSKIEEHLYSKVKRAEDHQDGS